MQLWYSNEKIINLTSQDLKIIERSDKLLKLQDEEIQIEYQQDTVCKFNL